MGKRGPIKKPVLKLIRGTLRDPSARAELVSGDAPRAPIPLTTPPPPPPGLSPTGKREWRRLAGLLTAQRILTELDLTALELLVILGERLHAARRDVARRGPVIKHPNGYEQRNPHDKLVRELQRDYLQLAAKFGLTPEARGRLDLAPARPTAPGSFAEYLKRNPRRQPNPNTTDTKE